MTPRATLQHFVDAVRPPEHDAVGIQRRIDDLTKPVGSLGRIEELALRIGTVVGEPSPGFGRAAVYVFAADHGVTAQGVSAYPSAVTAQMCANFSAGGAAINALARSADAEVRAVDVGVASSLDSLPGLLDRKIREGTADLSVEPAMSHDEALESVLVGARLLTAPDAATLDIVAIGEMGIGNTTSAAAVTAALTGAPLSDVVGRGTGVSDQGLAAKRSAVRSGLARLGTDPGPLAVLCEVGGLELGAMAGAMIGAAGERRLILVDGYISTAAALLAVALCPNTLPYLIASHRSTEPGHGRALEALELSPLLDLRLRLGEGTGAALAIPLVRGAAAVLRDMATFASAGVSTSRALPS